MAFLRIVATGPPMRATLAGTALVVASLTTVGNVADRAAAAPADSIEWADYDNDRQSATSVRRLLVPGVGTLIQSLQRAASDLRVRVEALPGRLAKGSLNDQLTPPDRRGLHEGTPVPVLTRGGQRGVVGTAMHPDLSEVSTFARVQQSEAALVAQGQSASVASPSLVHELAQRIDAEVSSLLHDGDHAEERRALESWPASLPADARQLTWH